MGFKKMVTKKVDKATEVRKILRVEKIPTQPGVLIPDVESSSGFALGPAFTGEFPPSLHPFYPLAEEGLPFKAITPNWSCYGKPIANRLWPKSDDLYIAWLDRMILAKGSTWKATGIFDAILLSRKTIPMDNPLFLAAGQFWSTTTNCFHFRAGMMGPTIRDICFLTGLRAHGEEANFFTSQKLPLFNYPSSGLSYSAFLAKFKGTKEVDDQEHVAFLIYWLNKFFFCVSSKKITKDFTDLAKALASGKKLAMAPLFLAMVFRGMKNLLDKRFEYAAGPLWAVTLWLWSYFPSHAPRPMKLPINTCYGLNFVDKVARDHSFDECFTFFYTELEILEEGWIPFQRDTVPSWLKDTADRTSDDQREMWANFLISRDLLYGMPTHAPNAQNGVEYYNAAQFARQFGLRQLIPLPPFQSANSDFFNRPVLEQDIMGTISSDFSVAKDAFILPPFTEIPEASEAFTEWWESHIAREFDKPVREVLSSIAPSGTQQVKLGKPVKEGDMPSGAGNVSLSLFLLNLLLRGHI